MIKANGQYTNQDIADLLEEVAIAYDIKKKNRFRIVSYENAADAIATYPQPIQAVWSQDRKALDNIPGVGEAIMGKLDYLFTENKLHPHWLQAFKNIHPAVFTFTKVPGIGPKTAFKLTKYLKFPQDDPVKALDKLVWYARHGMLRNIPKLGEKSETDILENTLQFLGRKEKMPLGLAQATAKEIIDYLHQQFPNLEIVPLGSLRRGSPLVGDIDLAAQSDQAGPILDYFVEYPAKYQTIAKGPKKASIRIRNDIRIDLMVQPKTSWGSLLQHFTGSKQHNIKLRNYAQSLGLSLSEYGIKEKKNSNLHTFDNETDFYRYLHLKYIPPEDRLGEGEIDKAKIEL
ncbi:type-X family DNA polymerase [Patescibacteria group bacterium]|nr:type-X family DNA polymerase [Patescibacteria group bacterium]